MRGVVERRQCEAIATPIPFRSAGPTLTVPVPGTEVVSWAATRARCRGTASAGAVTGYALHAGRRTCPKGVVAGPEDEPHEVRSITPARGDRGSDGAVAAVLQHFHAPSLRPAPAVSGRARGAGPATSASGGRVRRRRASVVEGPVAFVSDAASLRGSTPRRNQGQQAWRASSSVTTRPPGAWPVDGPSPAAHHAGIEFTQPTRGRSRPCPRPPFPPNPGPASPPP